MAITDVTYSSVDLAIAKSYLNLESTYIDDDIQIQIYIDVARAMIEKRTGKDSTYLDSDKMSTIVLLKIVSDFYFNKVSSTKGLQLDPMFNLLIGLITDLKADGLV